MAHGKFGTVINCMDGRTQSPVMSWMKETFHLDYVDTITEAGPDKILASEDGLTTNSIKARARISTQAHGSKVIVVVAHHDCAGNPVDKAQHLLHLEKAVQSIRSWNLPVDFITAIWVNQDWQVELIEV
jgi:hypothetical protein